LTDEPLEILLNGKLIATGEVVVINENFGIRITNIVSQRQRIDHMG
ncbi:FliM/FliN family flagellar motor switch protein, partial [Liquorilactobacillus nagelii]